MARVLSARGLNDTVVRLFAADDLRLAAYLDERFSSAAQPTDDEIRQAGESARQRLTDERRRTLVEAWTAELRRRADVTVLQ
jgi:DNA-binding LacI/PurR family transcriptional regulator